VIVSSVRLISQSLPYRNPFRDFRGKNKPEFATHFPLSIFHFQFSKNRARVRKGSHGVARTGGEKIFFGRIFAPEKSISTNEIKGETHVAH